LLAGGCLLIAPARAASTPDSALEAYRRGNFRSAQAQYSQLAREKAADARLRFNAGAAAYRNNDLTNAATWFESASGAPDLELQQQAYYNLGNTRFRLGEAAAEPQAKLKEWEQSVQHYGSALKLNQADTNAATNLALVRQAMEQLKQQMPQRPQSGQDDQKRQDNNKDQKDQDDQQQSPQRDFREQQNRNDQSKDQPQQNQKDEQESSGEKQDPQEQSKSPDAGKDSKAADETEQQRDSQPQAGQKSGQEKGGQDKEGPGNEAFSGEEGKPGEMTAVQAERLLDQQRGEEKSLIFRMGGSGKEAGQRARKNLKQW
jgi:Ca-activated chloride channel family protein